MSARLVELLRQRAALQAQLAELDRQIADATAEGTQAAPSPVAAVPPRTFRPSALATNQADPEALLSEYASSPRQVATDVRKGCLIYAAIAFILLAGGIFLLLRFYRH